MSRARRPTNEEFDALLAYRFRLCGSGYNPYLSTERGGLPFLRYDAALAEFFEIAAGECWTDYAYVPEEAKAMLEDKSFIGSASLDQVKTMLTYCVRGERFSTGHWGAMFANGAICALLERIQRLRFEKP